MSANVEMMAYRFGDRKDCPWHGLGMPIARNEEVTSKQFQQMAGAEWTAVKRPLWVRAHGLLSNDVAPTPFREHIESDMFALMRSDNHRILNYVSKQYQPVQNEEVFSFFHDFCTAGDMDLETGGVLDLGRTVWCLASIREGFTLAGGDNVQGYLLFSNSHGGSAGRIKFTPIRVVCANTLALAHGGSGTEFRIHHRTKFNSSQARDAIGLGHTSLSAFRERAEFLASRPMHSPAYKEFLNKLFPATIKEVTAEEGGGKVLIRPRNYDKAVKALWQQVGSHMSEGTWWQGYNAITYMVDHMHGRSDDGAALNSNWFGTGHKLKQQALETALEMAK